MKSKEMKTAAISVLLAGSLLAGCGSVAAGTSTTAGSTAAQTAMPQRPLLHPAVKKR